MGCATGTCTDPTCPICVGVARRFPPIVACPKTVRDGKVDRRCRYVKGHRGYCRPSTKRKDAIPVSEMDPLFREEEPT